MVCRMSNSIVCLHTCDFVLILPPVFLLFLEMKSGTIMRVHSLLRSLLSYQSPWMLQRMLSSKIAAAPCFFYSPKPTTLVRTFKCSAVHRSEKADSSADDDFVQEDYMQNILQYRRQYESFKEKSVLVIMPRQKVGPLKKTKEQAEFMLDETVALAESISGWKVIGGEITSTDKINSKVIFGKTNLQNLKDFVLETKADAIVFAKDIFTPYQHLFFQDYLGIEVYDRFSVVLRIFRERASTKEAKLQLALAELNYVRKNLHHMKDEDFMQFSISSSFGGNFDTFFEVKKQLIKEKELKLKKLLEKIDQNNALKKQHRMKVQIPSVAIVGYTNCGKTSLIKALTNDARLTPENRLFATLDVSVHMVNLPSNLKAVLIDTIGFISDIPTTLIHSFRSTLSEICSADLLVHVTDSSNPDWRQQVETVHSTLREINVPEKLIDSMVEVSNKVDKISSSEQSELAKQNGNRLLISTTERIGLDELKGAIERAIIANTDRLMFDIRVPNGGEHYQWLYREATVVECNADKEDANYLLMSVIVTKSKLGRFYKHFRK